MRPQISLPSVPTTHSAPNFHHSSRAGAKLGNKTRSNLEPKERRTETQNQDTRRREAADREIPHCKVNARAGGDSILEICQRIVHNKSHQPSGRRWFRGCICSLSNIVSTLLPSREGFTPPFIPPPWPQKGGGESRRSLFLALPWPFCSHLLSQCFSTSLSNQFPLDFGPQNPSQSDHKSITNP